MNERLERLIARVATGAADVRPSVAPLFPGTVSEAAWSGETLEERIAQSTPRRQAPPSPSADIAHRPIAAKPEPVEAPVVANRAAAPASAQALPAEAKAANANDRENPTEEQSTRIAAAPVQRDRRVSTRYVVVEREHESEPAADAAATLGITRPIERRIAPPPIRSRPAVAAQRRPTEATEPANAPPSTDAPPSITIEIGHIEVRAPVPPRQLPQRPPPPRRPEPALSLATYLDERRKGLR